MARKYHESIVCDRCGKEFEELPLDRARWIKRELVYMKALMFVGSDRLQSREMIPYDLCKECAESLVDWFLNGKQKGA